jgi:quinol monooxygenase YgiN
MAEQTLRVIAHIKARPGKVEEMRALLAGLIGPTRAEPGCLRYELLHSLTDPLDFTFVEEWRDGSALDSHFNTGHLKAALARFQELAAEPLDLRRYHAGD